MAEPYYPHHPLEADFGPDHFHSSETAKLRGKHRRSVGQTATFASEISAPKSEYSGLTPDALFGGKSDTENARLLREAAELMKRDEQKAMDAFRLDVNQLNKIAKKHPGEAVFELAEEVLGADAFHERLVTVDGKEEVAFVDAQGVPAIKIIEADNDGVPVTIIRDVVTYEDHYREISLMAVKGETSKVDITIVDGSQEHVVTDPDEQKVFVSKVIRHVNDIVKDADARDSEQARGAALNDLLPQGTRWPSDERARGIIRSGVAIQYDNDGRLG